MSTTTCERTMTVTAPAPDRFAPTREERKKTPPAENQKLIDAGSLIIKKALSAGRKVDFLEENVQVGGQ